MIGRRAFLGLLVTAALGVVAAGCGGASGVRVYSSSPHNLRVDNVSFVQACGVYVDGALIGTLLPRSIGYFDIVPGSHTVELRHGSSGLWELVGTYTFTSTTYLHVTFDDL